MSFLKILCPIFLKAKCFVVGYVKMVRNLMIFLLIIIAMRMEELCEPSFILIDF